MPDRDSERWYPNPWVPEGPRFESVTTILDLVASKFPLLGWNAREAARFAVENADDIAYVAGTGWGELAMKEIAGEPERVKTRAADLGKLVHRIAEAIVKGEPYTVTEEEEKAAEPYLDAFFSFMAEMRPEFEWAEATVYHKWQQYAGTTDGGSRFPCPIPVLSGKGVLLDEFPPGTLLNVDYKTGRMVWPEVVAQQVGYSTATHMGLRDALGTIKPMPKVEGAVVVHLGPNGYRYHGVRLTPSARAAWQHAVGWYKWVRHDMAGDLGVGIRNRRGSLCVDDLPGLEIRIRDRLAMDGVVTLADLEEYGEAAFRGIDYAGPKATLTARRLLALEGRSWPEPPRGEKRRKVAA